MKNLFFKILLLAALVNFMTCEKWDLEESNFIILKTGMVVETTLTTIKLESEISGLQNGKIEEHGHILSCVNPQPEFGQSEIETFPLGITFEDGKYTNILKDLTLNTTYYIRAFVLLENNPNPIYGEIVEVELGENELVVTTDSIYLFTGGFEVFGTMTGLQNDIIISKYGFVWSHEDENPTVEADEVIYLGLLNSDQSFQRKEENIEQLKNYHIRAFVQLGKDIFYGETKSFFKGDVWLQKSDAPLPLSGSYFSGVGNAGYVGAGFSPFDLNTAVFKYTPTTDTWEEETPLDGIYTTFGAAFSIGEILYTATGTDDIQDDLWAYNTVEKTWSQRSPFPGAPLEFTLATTIQGKGYLGLGVNPITGEHNDDIWVYDPQMDVWNQIAEFPPEDRDIIPFIFSNENELFIGFGPQGADQELWCYNVNTGEWTEKDFTPLADLFPVGISGFSIENRGFIVTSVPKDNFYEYDMLTNRWTKRADFPGPKRGDPIYFVVEGRCYYGLGLDFTQDMLAIDFWEYIPDVEEL